MTLLDFLSGSVTFGFLLAALFFLRFWRRTRDGLFLAFATAFLLLAPHCLCRFGSSRHPPPSRARLAMPAQSLKAVA